MKTIFLKERKIILLLISFLMAGLFPGCREYFIEMEADNLKQEKNGVVPVMSGTLPGGALYEIVLPLSWNSPLNPKLLLVYAHGYVDVDKPVALPSDSIFDGSEMIAIKDFVVDTMNLGYASTSYRENGLAVLDGVSDIVQLRYLIQQFFTTNPGYSPPNAVLLVGPSEGGLITVLTIEQNPGLFNAAMATCCPIGDFYGQLQYYGDAHVLFKYFFGSSINGINLGSPKGISKRTIAAWEDGSLQDAIIEVLSDDLLNNNGHKIEQFLACANIPADPSTPASIIKTILEVMRYPVKATNDIIYRLEGNPYNNKDTLKIYTGSDNDTKLNLTVERIKRSDWETAVRNVANYETSGNLTAPLVTMHNVNDHISFYQHQVLYGMKATPGLFFPIPVTNQYGHCNFTLTEIKTALNSLISP